MRFIVRLFSTRASLLTNPIINNSSTNEFQIRINKEVATVTYEKINNMYDLTHSSIPETYQGQGLGAVLAERVFDHLVQNNKKFKVSCDYLQKYLDKNMDKYKNSLY